MKTLNKLEPINKWPVYRQRPLVVSGPCSAESEQQLMQTARALAAGGRTDVLRAGIWKPRTRPGAFEGMGSPALKWLKKAQEETGIMAATEVATAHHVYEALKYGLSCIWIGARTTANPFAVQEIADALEGSGICVLIKNPVNPDPDLWLGAIERIYKSGITRIGAIHRGFSSYEKNGYRNSPLWMIPLEMKQKLPDLPMICDPSHICGNRSMLSEVAQRAMDLNFDGLMIETHIDPDSALSDAAQQITPDGLGILLGNLIMRNQEPAESAQLPRLAELRNKIDIFDEQLLQILEQRMSVARDIARHKRLMGFSVLQSGRWAEVMEKNLLSAREKGLGKEFIRHLFRFIHQESIQQQSRIMNPGEKA